MAIPKPEEVREALAQAKDTYSTTAVELRAAHAEGRVGMSYVLEQELNAKIQLMNVPEEQGNKILRGLWEANETAGPYQRARFEALGAAMAAADELYKSSTVHGFLRILEELKTARTQLQEVRRFLDNMTEPCSLDTYGDGLQHCRCVLAIKEILEK